MHANPASQTSSSVNSSFPWVVKSESDKSESVLYGFVTHVLTSSWGCVCVISYLGRKVPNTFLPKQRVTIFTSAVHHFCWLWMQSFDIEELLESPSCLQSCLLVLVMMSSSPTTLLLRTVGSLFPPHRTDTLWNLHHQKYSLKIAKYQNVQTPQNILHDKWNRTPRDD